jgi:hypothetical protein
MSDDELRSKRLRLGFVEEVLSAFHFLTNEYGFRCVEANSDVLNGRGASVRYESTSVFVVLTFDYLRSELEVYIGRLARKRRQEQGYSLDVIAEYAGLKRGPGHTYFQASTEEEVKRTVRKLAGLVRTYADSILRDDPRAFEQLAEAQSRISDAIMEKYT